MRLKASYKNITPNESQKSGSLSANGDLQEFEKRVMNFEDGNDSNQGGQIEWNGQLMQQNSEGA